MAKYMEMEKTGCFQKNPLGTSYEASQDLAATGKTLGLVQGNWVIALLKGKNPSGTFILKPLPATDDPAEILMPAAAGAGYGVNAKAKNKDLALKFVNFVMSPEGMTCSTRSRAACRPCRTPATPSTRRWPSVATFINERPHRAVHGPALAQRQGAADHAHRAPGDLQRTVHTGQGAGRDGHRLQGRA